MFYDLGLFRTNDKVAVLILGIAEEVVVVNLNLALLIAVLRAELYGLAHRLAFLLSKARHDRKEYLAFGIQRVYVLLLEIDRNVLVLELLDVLEAVESVSGKSADGLGDNHE